MKKRLYLMILLFLCPFMGNSEEFTEINNALNSKVASLSKIINPQALTLALKGYSAIAQKGIVGGEYLAIVDFSKSSTEKRFYLLSMKDTSLVHEDYVSHGKHSGELYANSFSNKEKSLKTSLGFYKISEMYYGNHGMSLRLDGLDLGFNDKARERAIVMHAASYAEPRVISELGRLGKSFGCPALPFDGFSLVASKITQNGVLFHYYPDESYLQSSVWLH